MARWLRSISCSLWLLVCGVAAGCSTYVIKGNVISGAVSDMAFVQPNDLRLREPPLTNVRITVQRDPDSLSRHLAGTDLSDAHGRFVIPLDEFGAGWMDEKWLIRATKPGFETATSMPRFEPGTKKMRLLVIMAPDMDSLLDASGALGEIISDRTPEAGRAFSQICSSHEDYIWQAVEGIGSGEPTEQRGAAGFSIYMSCDMNREDRADELFRDVIAPVFNKHVGDGELTSWNWLQQFVGGK